jgi:type IV fimbrial biogenesis protein FimT
MLIASHRQPGFSLIEIMVAMAIFIVLLGIAAPNFAAWIQNTQIRTASESVLNGLQLAKAEAVRRNVSVGFYLTDTADNNCALTTSGTNWVVSLADPTGKCATAPGDTVDPFIVQLRLGANGSKNAVVAADSASVIFSSLGLATLTAGTVNNINVSNSTGGSCVTTSGSGAMRCLRVVVSNSGQIRMCDPAVTSTSSAPDSRAC